MQAVGLGLVVSFPLPLIVKTAGGVTAAAVLTRVERVPWQMEHVYSCTSSSIILLVPCPIVLAWKEKNATNLSSLVGKKDPTPKQGNRQTPVRFLVGFTQELRGVAKGEHCTVPEGKRCPGRTSVAGLRLLRQSRVSPRPGGFGAAGRSRLAAAAGCFPTGAVCPPAVVTVYVRQ